MTTYKSIAGHEMTPERCAMWLEIVARGEAGLNVGGPSHFAVTEAKRLMAREPLVQEVIRAFRAAKQLADEQAPEGFLINAGAKVQAALIKLAEWKP